MVLDKMQRDTLSYCIMAHAVTFNHFKGMGKATVGFYRSTMCLDAAVEALDAVGVKIEFTKDERGMYESVIIDGYTYIL